MRGIESIWCDWWGGWRLVLIAASFIIPTNSVTCRLILKRAKSKLINLWLVCINNFMNNSTLSSSLFQKILNKDVFIKSLIEKGLSGENAQEKYFQMEKVFSLNLFLEIYNCMDLKHKSVVDKNSKDDAKQKLAIIARMFVEEPGLFDLQALLEAALVKTAKSYEKKLGGVLP